MGTVKGNFRSGKKIKKIDGRNVTVDVNDLDDRPKNYAGRFQSGTFFTGKKQGEYKTKVEILSNTSNSFFLDKLAGDWKDQKWKAIDDDQLLDGETIPRPKTGKLKKAFREAFIKVKIREKFEDHNIKFVENIGPEDEGNFFNVVDGENKNLKPQKSFWTATVVGCFQGRSTWIAKSTLTDGDPDTEAQKEHDLTGESGWQAGSHLINRGGGKNVTAVYVEPIFDAAKSAGVSKEKTEAYWKRVVVHMVGHLFGLRHRFSRGGALNPTVMERGSGKQRDAWRTNHRFSNKSIDFLRSKKAAKKIGSGNF